MNRDLKELKRIVRKAAGKVAMDSAISGISLTRSEMENLRHKPQPTGMDSNATSIEPDAGSGYAESVNRVRKHWGTIPQIAERHDKRLTKGPVDGLTFRHPGQPSLDSSVVFDAVEETINSRADNHEQERAALMGSGYDDALTIEEQQQIAVSLRADKSTSQNEAGARETGLEAANAAYARARGLSPVRVS